MRDPNIERLLGGYATNTLTESERSALFEAALDDQDLFNALQDEQVLRDLLQDSDSRAAIERALKAPAPQPRESWFTPAWAWGLGAGALAAAALTFVVLSPFRSRDQIVHVAVSKPGPTVLSRAAESPMPVPPAQLSEPHRRLTREKTAGPRAPVPQPVPMQFTPPSMAKARQVQSNAQLSEAVAAEAAAPSSLRAASAGYVASGLPFESIPYSLRRRGPDRSFTPLPPSDIKAGDSVQLTIRPPLSGLLTLQELSANGRWTNLFPAAGAGLPVTANQEAVLPDPPLLVNAPRQLRLVLNSGLSQVVTNLRLAPGTPSPPQ